MQYGIRLAWSHYLPRELFFRKVQVGSCRTVTNISPGSRAIPLRSHAWRLLQHAERHWLDDSWPQDIQQSSIDCRYNPVQYEYLDNLSPEQHCQSGDGLLSINYHVLHGPCFTRSIGRNVHPLMSMVSPPVTHRQVVCCQCDDTTGIA